MRQVSHLLSMPCIAIFNVGSIMRPMEVGGGGGGGGGEGQQKTMMRPTEDNNLMG